MWGLAFDLVRMLPGDWLRSLPRHEAKSGDDEATHMRRLVTAPCSSHHVVHKPPVICPLANRIIPLPLPTAPLHPHRSHQLPLPRWKSPPPLLWSADLMLPMFPSGPIDVPMGGRHQCPRATAPKSNKCAIQFPDRPLEAGSLPTVAGPVWISLGRTSPTF